ncbi:hypothetical protein [Virgibacillus senegalensis]|uniref:hypothetical protein n=1 Tax=Virgibacillus senegalensis TaxID=1499679 RepID=UPI00069D6DEA|nr:hypothetical protein [Virgibacillus senegalensis]
MFKNEKANIVYSIIGSLIILVMVTYILYPTLEGVIPWLVYTLILLGFVLFFRKQFYRWKDNKEN